MTCDTCDAYRRMADEWRARVAAVQAPAARAFEAGFVASGLSLAVYRPRMEAARAAFLRDDAHTCTPVHAVTREGGEGCT